MQKKDIFRKIVLFVSIFLILFSFLEIKARTMFRSRTDLSDKHLFFEEQRQNLEVLVLGPSLIDKGINPQYFDMPAFNLGYSGQDFYIDYEVLNLYKDKMPKLKWLVLDLSIAGIVNDSSVTDAVIWKDFFWKLHIPPRNKNIIDILLNTSVFFRDHYLFIDYFIEKEHASPNPIINSFYVPDPPPNDSYLLKSGFRFTCTIRSEEDLKDHAKKAIEHMETLKKKDKIVKENIDYFDKILAIAYKKGWNVIIVTTPKIKYYLDYIDVESKNEFNAIVEGFLKKYPNVIYKDFRNDPQFIQEDFLNAFHLNYRGAAKITRSINEIIKSNPI